MRVCLDGRVIGGAFSGIPRLTLNLIKRIICFGTEHEFSILMRPEASEGYIEPRDNARIVTVDVPPYSFWEQFRVPKVVEELGCDVFHVFTYAAPVKQVCKTIVAIHDLIPLEFPRYVGLLRRSYVKHVTGMVARRCWRVITLSEYSKWQICARLAVPPEKIVVVPGAVDPEFLAEATAPAEATKPDGRYILNVSNKWLHKNAATAVRVLKALERKCDHRLIMVGRQNPFVLRLIQELDLEDRVEVRENVSDQELAELYRGADVFLFPSLSEGFGLTPLEAMACGTPTICSYAGSLAEVLGDASVLVSPYDVEHMAISVLRILDDADFRDDLIRRGLERSHTFNWDAIARQILDIYEDA